MRRWVWVGLLFVAACSRTPLFDLTGATATGTGGVSGTGGDGGTVASGGSAGSVATGGTAGTAGTAGKGGSAGTAGSAGSGGSGGYVYATGSTCFGLADRGSRRFVDFAGAAQAVPELVLSSADAEQVSLVYQRIEQLQGKGLAQLTLAPWGDWPPTSLGVSDPLLADGGPTFDVATAAGDHFALAGEREYTDLFVDTAVTPGQPPSVAEHIGDKLDEPVFVTRGDSDYLFGFSRDPDGIHFSTHFARVPDLATPVLANSGCATAMLHADAVRAGDHYIVTFTSSRDVGACVPDGTGDGSPDRIEVVDLDDNNGVKAAIEPPAQGVVHALSMVRRSDGAWLAWQAGNMLMVARLDQQGNLVTLPNAFATMAPGTPFAVDRVGDDLALAYLENYYSIPDIRVQLFDSNSVGAPHVDFTVALDLATEQPVLWISVLGAPAGHQLLLSWEARPSGGSDAVITRRLDCVQAN